MPCEPTITSLFFSPVSPDFPPRHFLLFRKRLPCPHGWAGFSCIFCPARQPARAASHASAPSVTIDIHTLSKSRQPPTAPVGFSSLLPTTSPSTHSTLKRVVKSQSLGFFIFSPPYHRHTSPFTRPHSTRARLAVLFGFGCVVLVLNRGRLLNSETSNPSPTPFTLLDAASIQSTYRLRYEPSLLRHYYTSINRFT